MRRARRVGFNPVSHQPRAVHDQIRPHSRKLPRLRQTRRNQDLDTLCPRDLDGLHPSPAVSPPSPLRVGPPGGCGAHPRDDGPGAPQQPLHTVSRLAVRKKLPDAPMQTLIGGSSPLRANGTLVEPEPIARLPVRRGSGHPRRLSQRSTISRLLAGEWPRLPKKGFAQIAATRGKPTRGPAAASTKNSSPSPRPRGAAPSEGQHQRQHKPKTEYRKRARPRGSNAPW